MNRVLILRAGSVGDATPPPVEIVINEQIPDNLGLTEVREVFVAQAKELADALCASLPGGTLDQLMAELMSRRASLFVVPHFASERAKGYE